MIYQVNDLIYRCKVGSHREGFTHKIEILNKQSETLVTSTIKYYNRTWESYQYQSAMIKAQDKQERKIKQCKIRCIDYKYYDFENKPTILSYN